MTIPVPRETGRSGVSVKIPCVQCGKPHDPRAATGLCRTCAYHRIKDLTGQRFERLVVMWPVGQGSLNPNSKPHRTVMWLCCCDCGALKLVHVSHLINGQNRSCGCLQRQAAGERASIVNRKHGWHGTPEYQCWQSMLSRCTLPTHQAYKNYGGRGITVCERWRHDFANFIADVGPRPSPELSLDRIDNDGNYEPGNVRWATRREQILNQRKRGRDALGRFA